MITCMAIWNLQDEALAGRIEKVAARGFSGVSFLYTPRHEQQPDEDQRVIDLLERYDLAVTCHNAVGDNRETDADARLDRQMEEIAAWDERTRRVRCVCFDPGCRVFDDADAEADLERTARCLLRAHERLSPLGIRVGVENWIVNHRLEQFQLLAALTEGKAGCLIDLGHLNIAWHTGLLGGRTPAEFIEAMPLDVVEIHVHDNNGVEDSHWALGRGNNDIGPMVEALVARGFGGPGGGVVTVEHGGSAGDPAVLEAIGNTRVTVERMFEEAAQR